MLYVFSRQVLAIIFVYRIFNGQTLPLLVGLSLVYSVLAALKVISPASAPHSSQVSSCETVPKFQPVTSQASLCL